MLIVLSPSKALDFTRPEQPVGMTTPDMAGDIADLAKVAKKLKASDLKRLMSLSDTLAQLNRERFQAFDPAMEDGLQAAFAFNGDVYAGLQARTLDKSRPWPSPRTTCVSCRVSTACCGPWTASSPTAWRWGCG